MAAYNISNKKIAETLGATCTNLFFIVENRRNASTCSKRGSGDRGFGVNKIRISASRFMFVCKRAFRKCHDTSCKKRQVPLR